MLRKAKTRYVVKIVGVFFGALVVLWIALGFISAFLIGKTDYFAGLTEVTQWLDATVGIAAGIAGAAVAMVLAYIAQRIIETENRRESIDFVDAKVERAAGAVMGVEEALRGVLSNLVWPADSFIGTSILDAQSGWQRHYPSKEAWDQHPIKYWLSYHVSSGLEGAESFDDSATVPYVDPAPFWRAVSRLADRIEALVSDPFALYVWKKAYGKLPTEGTSNFAPSVSNPMRVGGYLRGRVQQAELRRKYQEIGLPEQFSGPLQEIPFPTADSFTVRFYRAWAVHQLETRTSHIWNSLTPLERLGALLFLESGACIHLVTLDARLAVETLGKAEEPFDAEEHAGVEFFNPGAALLFDLLRSFPNNDILTQAATGSILREAFQEGDSASFERRHYLLNHPSAPAVVKLGDWDSPTSSGIPTPDGGINAQAVAAIAPQATVKLFAEIDPETLQQRPARPVATPGISSTPNR